MKILHISNHDTLRCGVAEFGRQLSDAVRAAGHDVTDFEGGYPACHARGYFPDDWYTYDVVHLNWQPGTLNHYQPGVLEDYKWRAPITLPRWPCLSVFLHDLPPWSSCAIAEVADVRSALEPFEDYVVIPPPCLSPRPPLPLFERPTIGMTGIINPNVSAVQELCARHGWDLSLSSEAWVSNDEEIDRLSRCWVNVVWYNYHRSRSSSASIIATARRPTILSECTRFDHLKPWAEEFYWASDTRELERRLLQLVDNVSGEMLGPEPRHPSASVHALQWPVLIQPLLQAWEGGRR